MLVILKSRSRNIFKKFHRKTCYIYIFFLLLFILSIFFNYCFSHIYIFFQFYFTFNTIFNILYIRLCMGAKIRSFPKENTATQRSLFAKAAVGNSPTADESFGDLWKMETNFALKEKKWKTWKFVAMDLFIFKRIDIFVGM